MKTNEITEKQCKINKSFEKGSFKQEKKKRNTILIKCDKCLKEKMLKDIVTRTEIYKKKYYKMGGGLMQLVAYGAQDVYLKSL